MPDLDSTCPRCHGKVLLDYVEIDIGVGTQRFLTNGDCENCGAMLFCNNCGKWVFQVEPDFEHDNLKCERMTEARRLIDKTILGRGPTRYDLIEFEAKFGEPFDIGVVRA